MSNHPAIESLIDLLAGEASQAVQEHVARCQGCAREVEDLRATWRQVGAIDVPEPSPLYWEAFRVRVAAAVAEPPAGRRWSAWLWLPALGVAAATLALWLPSRVPATGPSAAVTAGLVPAWSALPEAAEDPALDVLQGLVAEGGIAPEEECQAVEDCLSDLAEDDARQVAETLGRELEGGRS